VGHAAIRARGTVGGSLALADPAAELPACAVALDATIRLSRRRGSRSVGAVDFFRGIYTTAVEPGEVVTEIVVPPGLGWRTGFEELARRHGDFALAGLAARLRLEGPTVREARLVFFGVGDRPVRARSAETALTGRGPDPEALAAAGRALGRDLDPPGDIHASPALRRHLAGVLLARVLRRMMDGAK
jgi:carbon-monoxide dehydrogenase medium subunit